jgi:hypothetical protein
MMLDFSVVRAWKLRRPRARLEIKGIREAQGGSCTLSLIDSSVDGTLKLMKMVKVRSMSDRSQS